MCHFCPTQAAGAGRNLAVQRPEARAEATLTVARAGAFLPRSLSGSGGLDRKLRTRRRYIGPCIRARLFPQGDEGGVRIAAWINSVKRPKKPARSAKKRRQFENKQKQLEASYIPLASDRLSSLFWTRLPNAVIQNRAIFIRLIMRPTERNRRGIDFMSRLKTTERRRPASAEHGTTRSNESVWQRPLSRVISRADIENTAAAKEQRRNLRAAG